MRRRFPVATYRGRRAVVSDPFHPPNKTGRTHYGNDIMWRNRGGSWERGTEFTEPPIYAAPPSAAIVASLPGIVTKARFQKRGGAVNIREKDGTVAMYRHLARIDVHVGQVVKGAQQIGLMGSGPRSRRHLHFALRYQGEWLDPTPILRDARHVTLLSRPAHITGWVVVGAMAVATVLLAMHFASKKGRRAWPGRANVKTGQAKT